VPLKSGIAPLAAMISQRSASFRISASIRARKSVSATISDRAERSSSRDARRASRCTEIVMPTAVISARPTAPRCAWRSSSPSSTTSASPPPTSTTSSAVPRPASTYRTAADEKLRARSASSGASVIALIAELATMCLRISR
jgi:hypothetical protein